jgi:glucose-1-phosphate cytidylyltransferase
MKVVILCGGLGMRIREETELRPKPMIEVGGQPILWHIMKIYSHYGFKEFVLCLGYKAWVIRRYFLDYHVMQGDATLHLGSPTRVELHSHHDAEDWKVTLADTGLNTFTALRIKQIEKYIDGDDFMLTYGDGVANVNIADLLAFHKKHGKIATVTAVHPSSRWGELILEGGRVTQFLEKPQLAEGYINGGFFVLNRRVFDYLGDDPTVPFERAPMTSLCADGELVAYPHDGYWQAMDTLRDLQLLNEEWASDRPAWKIWS